MALHAVAEGSVTGSLTGVPIDVLAELMDHKTLNITRR
jgi:hypothetical protein